MVNVSESRWLGAMLAALFTFRNSQERYLHRITSRSPFPPDGSAT